MSEAFLMQLTHFSLSLETLVSFQSKIGRCNTKLLRDFFSISQPSRCVNQIEEVCKDIEKTINQTIQNTLNQLERDCEQISTFVDQAIKVDDDARRHNFKAKVRYVIFFLLCVKGMLFTFVDLFPT